MDYYYYMAPVLIIGIIYVLYMTKKGKNAAKKININEFLDNKKDISDAFCQKQARIESKVVAEYFFEELAKKYPNLAVEVKHEEYV